MRTTSPLVALPAPLAPRPGQGADEFLGTQGDPGDTRSDMPRRSSEPLRRWC